MSVHTFIGLKFVSFILNSINSRKTEMTGKWLEA